MSYLETIKVGSDLDRHSAARGLEQDLTAEATQALIEALADPGVGEWPGDYDAPPFFYPVAEAAAESLTGRSPQHLDSIMAQARVSETAAFYVARMLGHLGQVGVEPLLELSQHPVEQVRAQAVRSLRQQYLRCGDGRLVTQLLQFLADPGSNVTYTAVGEVKALLEKAPEVRGLASPDLVPALMARCLAHPQAGTFSEALDFFAGDARIFDFQVEQAAAGCDRPCTLLQYTGLHKLQGVHVERLCRGELTVALINLLGWLGERAVAAAPRLLELVQDGQRGRSAVMALLAMPSQAGAVLDFVPDLYVGDHLLRERILKLHPDLGRLAREVLPRLSPRARKQDGDAFRAMANFGRLAVGEAPWLYEMARFGVPDYFRNSAVELLGDFGELALPAFPSFYQFLEFSATRPAVLRALIKLGRVASEFEVPLEVIKLESSGRIRLHKDEAKLLEQALAAVRGA